ncbi:UNVERIFIED_CONTAM: hypothetical protein Sindi_1260400 [Sesamum indicum]
MSTPAGHVTVGDGPTITEEDGEETGRSSETANSGEESERTRDHFPATDGSGTVLDADASIQTEKEVNLAGETTRFEAPLDLGFSTKKCAVEDEMSRFMKPTSDGIFPANKAGNDFMEMRGSILNEKYGNLDMGKSGYREPPFLGFSSTFNGGRGKVVSPQDFNISEFLNLANRVVDNGDAAAMEALAKLKTRWEEKFGLVENLRTQRNFGRLTIKPRRCILKLVTETMRREGSTAMVTIDIPSVVKLQTMETEKTSDSRDKLAGSNGEDGSMTGKQSEGMIQSAAISGLEVSPKNQSWPESGHIPMTNSSPPTCADVDPTRNDVENVVDLEADVGICADIMHEVSNDVMDDVATDVMDDVAADVTGDVSNNVEKNSPTITQVHSFPMGLFVGNIPLNANSNMGVDDKIADAFNNSSRRTLSYIPPTIQHGEVVVRPTMETIRNGSIKWKTTAVGYFLGKRPYFYHVKNFAFSAWPGLREVKATMNGFFFFQFKTVVYMEEAIEGGPSLFQGQPITEEGLSTVASGIGKPLYPDAITRACTRLDFAHACVMLDVSVYVPKTGPAEPITVHVQVITAPPRGEKKQRDGRESPHGGGVRASRKEKGKEIVVYNTFYALHLINDADDLARGPNQSSPILAAIQPFLLPNSKWFVEYGMVGNRIWIAWDENFIDVDVVECGTQFIHYLVYIRSLRESIVITVIYGATEVADRRELRGSLETIAMQTVDIPWLIGGDFNAVRDISEMCGASGDIRMPMEEFNNCIQNAGLLPLPMDSEQQYGGMFQFDNYLTRSPEFIPSVQHVWQHNIIGVPMYAVTRKLKALKSVFREQRRNKGDLSHNVQLAKGFLEMAQILVSSNRQDELFLQLEHCCRFILAKAAKLEQSMLQQRAKMQWMKGGHQCSRVFFRKIAQRRSARRILQINDDHGTTHTEPQAVVNEFVMYYQNLLGGEQRRDVIDLRFLRPWVRHLLSEEEVHSLLLPFTPVDVKQAVFDIAEDKAPGSDEYSSGFFKAAWPIVGQEVTSAVLDFFNTG